MSILSQRVPGLVDGRRKGMRLGFIGVGTMGAPIVGHLLRHGHQVIVFARRPEALAAVVASGAVAAPSAAVVGAQADAVFTMVTGTADVEAVIFGPEGLAGGLTQGALAIDMSTVSPTATRAWAERLQRVGIDFVDAPVSGGPEGAKQGTLTIMAGGSAEAFERARPLFECFGATVLHMGPSGAGQTTKACAQLALLINAEGAAEALTLAAQAGVDPTQAQKALMSGIAASRVLERFGSRMAARNFEGGIPTRIYRKDLQTVLDYAGALGVTLPAASVVMAHIASVIDAGGADLDLSALITTLDAPGRTPTT